MEIRDAVGRTGMADGARETIDRLADGAVLSIADTNGDGVADMAAYDADGDGVIEAGVIDTDY